jgi:hypothetical protein
VESVDAERTVVRIAAGATLGRVSTDEAIRPVIS